MLFVVCCLLFVVAGLGNGLSILLCKLLLVFATAKPKIKNNQPPTPAKPQTTNHPPRQFSLRLPVLITASSVENIPRPTEILPILSAKIRYYEMLCGEAFIDGDCTMLQPGTAAISKHEEN